MVKQYRDGYFIDGRWYAGQYYDNIEREGEAVLSREYKRLGEAILERHTRPIEAGKLVRLNDEGELEQLCNLDHTPIGYLSNDYPPWCESVDTPYIQYLLMGGMIVLLLAIAFMVAITIF